MKRILIYIFPVLSFTSLKAQDFTLYNMQYMQQRTFLNPAFIPKSNVQVGIPGLSSIGLNLSNSGFKYSDLVISEGDSLRIDVPNMLDKLKDKNNFTINNNLEIISFGFRVKKNYFHAAVRENITAQLVYPKGFFSFLWQGNGPTAGEELQFGFGLNLMQYHEFSLSYAREVNDKLTVGATAKILKGVANLTTKKTDITMQTHPDSAYDITLSSNILMQSSGLMTPDSLTPYEYNIMGSGNTGFAFDFGAQYKLNEKINLSASVVNLGSIKWTNQVVNWVSNQENASYTFKGLPLKSFFGSDSAMSKSIEGMVDSLASVFDVDSTYESYSTSLPVDVRLGFNYQLMRGQNAGLNLLLRSQNGSSNLGVTVFYGSDIGRWLSVILTYSYYNASWTNLGLGLRVNAGPVQLHLMSDNIFAAIMPQHAKYVNIRTGLNLTFGGKTKKVKLD
jgi:hypothetical protein